MNKFFSKIALLFLFAFAAQVANAGCPAKWGERNGVRVRVANSECVATLGRTGDGDYNGRRGFGMVVGGLLGGGIAHALGGDPSAIVGGLFGGAQAGTYIGSTYDEDAKVRDITDINRTRCGTGTYYNTVTKTCEVDNGVTTEPSQSNSPPLAEQSATDGGDDVPTFQTIPEVQEYCSSRGEEYSERDGGCIAPAPVAELEQAPQRVATMSVAAVSSSPLEAWCRANASCPLGQVGVHTGRECRCQ